MIRSAAIALGAFVALAGALRFAGWLMQPDIEVVRVSGTLNDAESAEVRDAVSTALAVPGLRAAGGVAEAVQALDWVREVRVRRQWPDGLHVTVARETLAARWGDAAWLATNGNVVAAPSDAHDPRLATLPMLRASNSDGERAMGVFAALSEASRNTGLRLVGLDEDAGGEWKASFESKAEAGQANKVEVLLGATDLRERLARFATVYGQALAVEQRPFLYADARYDAGVAVREGPAPRLKVAASPLSGRGDTFALAASTRGEGTRQSRLGFE